MYHKATLQDQLTVTVTVFGHLWGKKYCRYTCRSVRPPVCPPVCPLVCPPVFPPVFPPVCPLVCPLVCPRYAKPAYPFTLVRFSSTGPLILPPEADQSRSKISPLAASETLTQRWRIGAGSQPPNGSENGAIDSQEVPLCLFQYKRLNTATWSSSPSGVTSHLSLTCSLSVWVFSGRNNIPPPLSGRHPAPWPWSQWQPGPGYHKVSSSVRKPRPLSHPQPAQAATPKTAPQQTQQSGWDLQNQDSWSFSKCRLTVNCQTVRLTIG